MSKYCDVRCLTYRVLAANKEVVHYYAKKDQTILSHDITALWRQTTDGQYEFMQTRPLVLRMMLGQTMRNQMVFTIGPKYVLSGVTSTIHNKSMNDETFTLNEGPYAYHQRQVSFRTAAMNSVRDRMDRFFSAPDCRIPAETTMLHVLCRAGNCGIYTVHNPAGDDPTVLMMTDAALHFFTARTPVSSCSDFIDFAEACAQDDVKTLQKNYIEVFDMKVEAVIKEHPDFLLDLPKKGSARQQYVVPTFIACMQPKAEHILPPPFDSTTVRELRDMQTLMFDELYADQTDNMCLDPVNSETEFMSDILQENEIDWQQYFD